MSHAMDDDVGAFNAALSANVTPLRHGGGAGEGGEAPARTERPPPVTPIGHRDGVHYFFDPRGQERALNPTQIANRGHLDVLLCGEMAWAVGIAPAFDKEGNPTGDYSAKELSRELIRMNSEIGLFDTAMPRRGPGVWRVAGDALALHLGDLVMVGGGADRERRRAGFRDWGALWPAHPAVTVDRRPKAPASAAEAAWVEDVFARWNWGGQPQAGVFFGLWAAHLCGAAVRWRPHGIVVGPPGSGKTTLMSAYAALSPLAVMLNDFTEAGLRQMLTGRALPLLLDEAEGDAEGVARLQRVVELLRKASGGDGAQSVRGSAGGASQRFEVFSPALLGAVLPPSLLPQDASRITRLDLHPRREGGAALPTTGEIAEMRKRAPALWGRALAGLPRLEANLAVLWQAMLARGCAPRLADQVGTILAARAMMLRDDVLDAVTADEEVSAFAWLTPSEADQAPDAGPASCLTHLMQSSLEVQWNGERPTVGKAVRLAMQDPDSAASRALVEHGLLLAPWPRKSGGDAWLLVADKHPRLERMFEGTQWAGRRWKEDLRRLPGAVVPEHPQWVGDTKPRVTVLPPGVLPERDQGSPASVQMLEELAAAHGLGAGWIVAALKARWSPVNARVAAREAEAARAPRPHG